MSQGRTPPGARRPDASRLQLKCRDLMGRRVKTQKKEQVRKTHPRCRQGKKAGEAGL